MNIVSNTHHVNSVTNTRTRNSVNNTRTRNSVSNTQSRNKNEVSKKNNPHQKHRFSRMDQMTSYQQHSLPRTMGHHTTQRSTINGRNIISNAFTNSGEPKTSSLQSNISNVNNVMIKITDHSAPQPAKGIRHNSLYSRKPKSNSEFPHDIGLNTGKPVGIRTPEAKRPSRMSLNVFPFSVERRKSEADLDTFLNRIDEKIKKTYLKTLSIPSSSAMQKASNKILPRRWKNKSKGSSNCISAIWRPEGCCTWGSVSGRKVVLQSISILMLSKAVEQEALQKVALTKVQHIMPDCSIEIPKACTDVKRQKRLKKRSQSVNLGGLLTQKEEPQPVGLVFDIPLSRCIANENNLKKLRQRNPDIAVDKKGTRKPSASPPGSMETLPHHNGNTTHQLSTTNHHRSFHAGSNDSLSESEGSSQHTDGSTSLIDALSLSISGRESLNNENIEQLSSDVPMVPQIVLTCFKHIETYGLQVLGIFRVGSSRKRVKQLRDEFDSGKDVVLDESQNPHDVGALLKEYFRDLPEPLLTRDLYSSFVATRRIQNAEKQVLAMKMLVSLLPVPNRDTLWALMRFLRKVAEHSTDSIDVNGETLPGNKMDSSNLATLFGPNILHKAKMGERKYFVESTARAEERKEVIEVVRDMIDSSSIFEMPPDIYDEVLRHIMEEDPETSDKLLKHIASDSGVEADLDTSYGSVFDESEGHRSPNHHLHYSSASDVRQSNREETNRQTLRQTSSTSSPPAPICPPDSERDDTDPRQGRYDYHGRQARMILRQRCKQPTDQQLSPIHSLHVPSMLISRSPLEQEKPTDSRIQSCTLAIPQQSQYLRQNSCPGLCSSTLSSSPLLSASSVNRDIDSNSSMLSISKSERELSRTGRTRQLTRSRESSPVITPRITSSPLPSLQQPRLWQAANTPLQRSAEWQRERWRHWGMLTSENSDDTKEQETLV